MKLAKCSFTWLAIFAILTLIAFINAPAGAQTSPPIHHLDPYNPEYETGVVLIKMTDESNIRTMDEFLESFTYERIQQTYTVKQTSQMFPNAAVPQPKTYSVYKSAPVKPSDLGTIFKLQLDKSVDAKQASEEFSDFPDVEYAEPDYFVYTMLTEPNDALADDQWYLEEYPGVNAKAAWDSTTGDTTQIIAIIDTGVDWEHPDLDDNIWRNWEETPGNGQDDDNNGYSDDIRGWDWINDDANPTDDNGHGTHVAGIAAAEGDNEIGIAGICWNAKIMPLKVMQSSGRGNSSDIALGIDYASENGATVINMSIGTYAESMTMKRALENAYANCVLVAAAGNDGRCLIQEGMPSGNMFPACYSFVLGVQASTDGGGRAGFSNNDPSGPVEFRNHRGHNYELTAPGVGILSAFPGGDYRDLNGTSMASPLVAGTVALLKTYDEEYSTEQLFARLIQGSNQSIMDILGSINIELEPVLNFVNFTLVDTLENCDIDGRPDASETLELWLTVVNAGAHADSVWAELSFAEFEDTTVAVIQDGTSYIGDMSTYATLTGEEDPFIIEIDDEIANDRDIVFEYTIGSENVDPVRGEIIMTANNTAELGGLFASDTTLSADLEYWIMDNLRIAENATLTLEAGVNVYFNVGKLLDIDGVIHAEGAAGNMVTFHGNSGAAIRSDGVESIFSFTRFRNFTRNLNQGSYYFRTDQSENCVFNDVILEDNSAALRLIGEHDEFNRVNIIDNLAESGYVFGSAARFTNCNIVDNSAVNAHLGVLCTPWHSNFIESSIFSNDRYSIRVDAGEQLAILHYQDIFWGTTDTTQVHQNEIYDFYDQGDLAIMVLQPLLDRPPAECHGIVWKVELNEANLQYDDIDPIGMETVKFDVFFNREMETAYTPFLTFGVREPWTQHVVTDSAEWNEEATIWTAYYTFDVGTGDGIQTIRVQGAQDLDHFKIPVEDSRFHFVVQAAGAEGIEFVATPGIGKVELEWPPMPSDDIIGYNMYRFTHINDSTFSDTTLINNTLIADTIYTDFEVNPDQTYFYMYSVLGTDMVESDYSKSVSGTPFDAPTGDANGDEAVNVQDIVTIVGYIIGNDPAPFLFDAADINEDDVINVLDIIGVVNIIINDGDRNASSEQLANALIRQNDRQVLFDIEGNAGGLQYTVKTGDFDELKIHQLEGMELITHKMSDDEMLVLIYSFNGRAISSGQHELMSYPQGTEVEISGAIAGDPLGVGGEIPVVTGDAQLIPSNYQLYQNFPNPFNHRTTIAYDLPEVSDVVIKVYNLLGREVYNWNLNGQQAGQYRVVWSGVNNQGIPVTSGLYFVSINTNGFRNTKKMVLLK